MLIIKSAIDEIIALSYAETPRDCRVRPPRLYQVSGGWLDFITRGALLRLFDENNRVLGIEVP